MFTDQDYEELVDPIVDIYNKIEMELMLDVAKRFSTYSSIDGTLEWYLKKLEEMNVLNDKAVKIFAKYSSKSEKEIRTMLSKSRFANFIQGDVDKAYDLGISKISYDDLIQSKVLKNTLELSYKELDKTFKLIQTKAIESQKQVYMNILNKAYINVSSGTYSYQQSIKQGIEEMARKGITGASYQRKDGTVMNYSIEPIVRRDTLTAVHQMANRSSIEGANEVGTNYVDIPAHYGARINDKNPIANHAGWQGKQYQIEGSSKEYPNLIEATGYGNILGFSGVNCRHHAYPFWPEFSVPIQFEVDSDKNRIYYENTQKLRKLERDIRKLKKERHCMEEIGDINAVKDLDKKIRHKSSEINAFCKETSLKRQKEREQVI